MFRVFLAGAVFALSGVVYASVPSTEKWLFNADQGSGEVEFHAIGRPSALKIHGTGSAPHGTLILDSKMVSGSLTFDLGSLNTGIKLRDEHMKQKYLEVGKFAQATLALSQFPIPESIQGERGQSEEVPFKGTLLLHGIQKPVSGVATLNRNGKQMKVRANFDIKVTDYGIVIPSFAGITMAEDVQVTVQIAAALSLKE